MKKFLLVLGVLFVFLGLALFIPSEWCIWNEKADPLPEFKNEEISYIEMFTKKDRDRCKIGSADRVIALEYLANAEPTRTFADDWVYAEDYRGMNIKIDDISYSYYVYKDGRETYLVSIYEGIYKVDAGLFELLDGYVK